MEHRQKALPLDLSIVNLAQRNVNGNENGNNQGNGNQQQRRELPTWISELNSRQRVYVIIVNSYNDSDDTRTDRGGGIRASMNDLFFGFETTFSFWCCG